MNICGELASLYLFTRLFDFLSLVRESDIDRLDLMWKTNFFEEKSIGKDR